MRVISLVPSATETLYLLGAGDDVVGVTYACDQPPEARMKKVVVTPAFDTSDMPEEVIDSLVREYSRMGKSLYKILWEDLKDLKPDLIIVQGVCDVCAVTPKSLDGELYKVAKVLEVSPRSVSEILADILAIGEAVGRRQEALELVEGIRVRIDRITELSVGLGRRRVFFMEWLDPPFCSGHWIPELVEIAGGHDLGAKGLHSRRVTEPEILAHNPEIIIAAPCGFNLQRARDDAYKLLSSKYTGRSHVYAVDAGRYFSRHGPGIADAAEILAEIIHPLVYKGYAPEGSYAGIE
ncbi:MAG: cobalamin-binding protein [Nitrososphaerota archaeon]